MTAQEALDFLRGASKKTKEYFAPVSEKVRARDILREAPKAALEVGKGILQSITRSGAAVGLTAATPFVGTKEIRSEELAPTARKVKEFVFGEEPVKSIQQRVAEGELAVKETGKKITTGEYKVPFTDIPLIQSKPIGELFTKGALPISFVGVGLSVGLDFTGGGGEKNVVKVLAKEVNVAKVSSTLKKIGVTENLVKEYAPIIAKMKNETEVSKTLNTIAEVPAVGLKERGFITSVKEAEVTAPEVKKGLKGTELFYSPITNRQTLADANDLILRDINEATRLARSLEPATPFSNAVAQELIIKFQNEGRIQDAIDVARITAQKATTPAQALQALSMYGRLTPEGVLRYAQQEVSKAGGTLTEEVGKAIVEQAKKAQALSEGREKIIETAKILTKIADSVPSSIAQKISFVQTLFQLLNPKTAIRNFVGNLGFAPIENVKDYAAASLDSALSFATGKRTKGFPSIGVQIKGFKEGFLQGVEDALKRVDTSAIATKYDLPKIGIFKGKVGQAAEKLLNLELRAPDRAFYKAAYDGSLYEQMKVAGVSEPTDTMKEIAHLDGLYRTFQDDNIISKLFVGLKRALNVGQDFGLGDILIKYPKTPANLLARGIEYSPGGFVNALYETARPVIGKPFNQRKFVESFSRALVGTSGLIGIGALLHRVGIITGKREKDPDVRELRRLTGLGQYKINASALTRFVMSGLDAETAKMQEGDTQISYDWFQPIAIGVSIGANIDEGAQQRQEPSNWIASFISALTEASAEGIDTLAEQPLLTGLKKIMGKQDISDSIMATLQGIPSSFVPTFLSQINQFIDNTQRNAYSPDTIQYGMNLAYNRIPGFSQTLPPSVDVFGNDLERYQGDTNNLFNVFFNPAFVSSYVTTPEAQLVVDLMNETGETKQFARKQSYTQTINGEKMKLTPTQITAFQRYTGKVTRELFNSFAQDQRFQNLSSDEKVKYISNTLTDIGSAGRIVILGNRPQKPSKRTLQIIQMFR